MAFGLGSRSKLPIGVDPKVLGRNITIEDYELALTLAEHEIVTLEDQLETVTADRNELRARCDFLERALAHRRKHSNLITIVGATNGRKSQAE